MFSSIHEVFRMESRSFPIFVADPTHWSPMTSMTDIELARQLRTLRRTVLMLQTELRHGQVDSGLIAEIDQQLDHGLGLDNRCEGLPAAVDAVRENTMTPRPELLGDTIRACERLKEEIEAIISRLG